MMRDSSDVELDTVAHRRAVRIAIDELPAAPASGRLDARPHRHRRGGVVPLQHIER